MIIKNGFVFSPDGSFHKKDLYTRNDRIVENSTDEDELIDAEGLYVLPGLIDIHTHGAVSHDFCDGDSLGLTEIAAYEHSNGITSFCPTSMTFSEEILMNIFKTVNEVTEDKSHAQIVGIHMEGPFISPAKKGAQKESYIQNPDISMFKRLNDSCGGKIQLITIAPELPGSEEFIRELHDTTTISLGHSAADYDTASRALSLGACHATHLFNAMPPLHHRDPGIIGAMADDAAAMVEIICDGVHIHPSMIRNTFRLFGDDRVILISDSMRATGMPDGESELGGQKVFKKGKWATLSDGTLAGSVTNLFDCMRNAVSFGIPLASAVKAVTCNPAKSIGVNHSIGSLVPGLKADILLVDKDLNLVRVL